MLIPIQKIKETKREIIFTTTLNQQLNSLSVHRGKEYQVGGHRVRGRCEWNEILIDNLKNDRHEAPIKETYHSLCCIILLASRRPLMIFSLTIRYIAHVKKKNVCPQKTTNLDTRNIDVLAEASHGTL